MGIYLPNMEMPKSCDECPLYTCMHNHDDCPLVPVPPHGRLIDADALREDWLENGENEYVYDTNAFLDSLDAAPTIIQAEEGET